METEKNRDRNLPVIIFVIFCNFPLDELEIPVYNTATNESTRSQPPYGWGLSPTAGAYRLFIPIYLGGKQNEDT